jgi:hypothetical protein
MAEKSPADVILGILKCYQDADHCLVNALLIDDRAKRIEAGLKCLTDRDICLHNTSKGTIPPNPDIRVLKDQLRRVR